MLNIPYSIIEVAKKKKNILLMGMGGGFDVYGGVPIYFTLKKLGINNIHFANFSFSSFEEIFQTAEPEIINSNLIGANHKIFGQPSYYPEGYLAEWLYHITKKEIPVWTMNKTGVNPLRASIRYLIERLEIDLIILLDGGVDSINTGAEEGSGTILEDAVTITALSEIEGVDKIVACVGFGTEVEEKVCGYNVLMNMAIAIKNDGFFGSCSLTKNMECYKFYKSACVYTFNKNGHKTSHIHRRIIPAVEGEFGDFHSTNEDPEGLELFISPIMPIYWFFDYQAIFLTNQLISRISDTNTWFEAVQAGVPFVKNTNIYPRLPIPY
ncbi:MAG: DUF1152 domain-containing protein [Crocinitomicaceae bacterium]|nr:MAG: DUF1152 domain-containing protein [Crocinitomicaceae bacterium]